MIDRFLLRIRKPLSQILTEHVIPNVTPILSFGDPVKSEIATVSINPSSDEWPQLSNKPSFGFKSLSELGLTSLGDLATCKDELLEEIYFGGVNYFVDNNYLWKWFDPIKTSLENGLSASYIPGNKYQAVCHIDLSPWTTSRWSGLPNWIQREFLAENVEFYGALLSSTNFRKIIFLGSTTWNYTIKMRVDGQPLVKINEEFKTKLFSSDYPTGTGLPEVGHGIMSIAGREIEYYRISQSPSDSRTQIKSLNLTSPVRLSVNKKYEEFAKFLNTPSSYV